MLMDALSSTPLPMEERTKERENLGLERRRRRGRKKRGTMSEEQRERETYTHRGSELKSSTSNSPPTSRLRRGRSTKTNPTKGAPNRLRSASHALTHHSGGNICVSSIGALGPCSLTHSHTSTLARTHLTRSTACTLRRIGLVGHLTQYSPAAS